ncbi:MAG: DUF4157 domain-containing protein [Myxococcales bacterium]|nr:DUF4157 domain-containing protein [Myxococcales bacterium]
MQRSFGHHDVSRVRAHVGGAAAEAAAAIGARAYATGDAVAFAEAPSLELAAHEAAHVVQQRGGVRLAGGVGATGDAYERHADEVAARVVRGESAEALLDTLAHRGAGGGPAVQRADRNRDGIEDEATLAPGATAEPLATLEGLLQRSTVAQLAATKAAIPARLRTRAPAGVYALAIAGAVHHAAAADLGAIFRIASERSRITGDAAEARQDWGRYELGGAELSERDDTAIAAVARNDALGLHSRVITALWEVVLHAPHPHPFFTRTLTDAMRAQGVPDGVLDGASIRRLHLGEVLAAFDRRHPRPPVLAGLTDAQVATLGAALGAPAGAITRTETARRRGAPQVEVTITAAFAAAAAAWQAWHLRGTDRSPTGHLTAEDLAALGVTTAAAASDAAAPDAAITAPDPDGAAAPADPRAPRVTAAQRTRIEGFRTELQRVLGHYDDPPPPIPADPATHRAPPRGERERINRAWRASHRAEVDAELTARLRETLTTMETLGVADWSAAQALQGADTVIAWGRRIDAALAELVGAGGSHSADAAAAATLRDGGFVVGDGRLVRSGWDARLSRDGRSPEELADTTLPALRAYRSLVESLHGAATAALAGLGPRSTHDELEAARPRLRRALEAIAHHLHLPEPAEGTVDAARMPLAPPPRLIRNSITVPRWPDDPALDGAAGALRTQVAAWDAVFRPLLGRARSVSIESAERATEHYDHGIVNSNPDALYVDLHRTGVEVTNNHGNALTPDETATRRAGDSDGDNSIHLDPEFALAMVQFLTTLAGMGATRMWTSGFLRGAMSYADTHPMGMACDITGFTFSDGTIIHLRSGYPRRGGTDAATDDAARAPVDAPEPDASDTSRGHSDWFDYDHHFAGRTHAAVMMGIAAMMPSYFHRIIGPGHNAQHMAHFHVELSPSGAPRDGLRLHAVSSESTHLPDWARAGADRHDARWDDGVEPIPLLATRPATAAGDADAPAAPEVE